MSRRKPRAPATAFACFDSEVPDVPTWMTTAQPSAVQLREAVAARLTPELSAKLKAIAKALRDRGYSLSESRNAAWQQVMRQGGKIDAV